MGLLALAKTCLQEYYCFCFPPLIYSHYYQRNPFWFFFYTLYLPHYFAIECFFFLFKRTKKKIRKTRAVSPPCILILANQVLIHIFYSSNIDNINLFLLLSFTQISLKTLPLHLLKIIEKIVEDFSSQRVMHC